MQTQLNFSEFLTKTDGGGIERLLEKNITANLFVLFKPKMLEGSSVCVYVCLCVEATGLITITISLARDCLQITKVLKSIRQ